MLEVKFRLGGKRYTHTIPHTQPERAHLRRIARHAPSLSARRRLCRSGYLPSWTARQLDSPATAKFLSRSNLVSPLRCLRNLTHKR